MSSNISSVIFLIKKYIFDEELNTELSTAGVDPDFRVRGGEIRRGGLGPQSGPGRSPGGGNRGGGKPTGSSCNLEILGPKILHFHVKITFPSPHRSCHVK